MKDLTREQKLEILDKWCNNTATEEEIETVGARELLLMLIETKPEKLEGTRHIYYPGKISLWVD